MIWRLLFAEQLSVSSPNEVLWGWTWRQVMDAHELLDIFEDAQERVRGKKK